MASRRFPVRSGRALRRDNFVSLLRLGLTIFFAVNLSAITFLYNKLSDKAVHRRAQATDDDNSPIQPYGKSLHRPYDTLNLNTRHQYPMSEATQTEHLNALNQLKSHLLRSDITSCHWNGTNYTTSGVTPCKDSAEAYVYYNVFPQSRILCQRQVAPYKFAIFTEPCNEPSTLYGRKFPAVVIEYRDPNVARMRERPCDVPCFEIGKEDLYSRLTIRDTNFKFLRSMESSRANAHLKIDPMAYREGQFISSTSFESEVPVPYYAHKKSYKIQNPAVPFQKAIPAAVFLARNCYSKNDREKIVSTVAQTFQVDALSQCLHNANPPHGAKLRNKTDIMQRYMFYLAFENANVRDYITEKLWGALEAGTIPVYFGAPNILEHTPPNSIVNVNDYSNYTELALYLRKVSTNETLYNLHHEWRTKPLPKGFLDKYGMSETHSTCRMCRWGHARRHGLRWDHQSQSILESHIPRQPCVSLRGLMVDPLREVFGNVNDTTDDDDDDNCSPTTRNKITMNGTSRNLFAHDNLIDLNFDKAIGLNTTWKFKSPFSKPRVVPAALGMTWLQNANSRITICTYPRVQVTFNRKSEVISIPVLPGLSVRIITEDLDLFHKDAAKVESFYGKRMKDDLWKPFHAFMLGSSGARANEFSE